MLTRDELALRAKNLSPDAADFLRRIVSAYDTATAAGTEPQGFRPQLWLLDELNDTTCFKQQGDTMFLLYRDRAALMLQILDAEKVVETPAPLEYTVTSKLPDGRTEKFGKLLRIARKIADEFSKDPSTKVGCVIVDRKSLRVLSTGYNGFPSKVREDIPARWERPLKYRLVVHAERNAIDAAARYGTALDGSVAVVTHPPCAECAKSLIGAGISVVIACEPDAAMLARWVDDMKYSRLMFEEAGVEFYLLPATVMQEKGEILISEIRRPAVATQDWTTEVQSRSGYAK